jgi:hypothetical protein
MILQISTSQVARIIDVSYWHPTKKVIYIYIFSIIFVLGLGM